jgi:hypothetical protein
MRKNRLASGSLDRFFEWLFGPTEEDARVLMEREERTMAKVDALLEERDRLHTLAKRALEQLIWCSGSADFQSDGVAREGWELGVRPVIDDLRAELKGRDGD